MPDENEPTSPIDPLTIGELISLPEAAKLSGFSHGFLKEMAEKGRLRARKIGRNWATTIACVEDYKRNRSYIRKKD